MRQVKYIRQEDATARGEGSGYVIRNFVTKALSEKVSVAVSELTGEAPRCMNIVSDRTYYFIDGDAVFEFAGTTIRIEAGSVLFVPAKTEYKMRGRFKAVLINAPAFEIGNEKHLD